MELLLVNLSGLLCTGANHGSGLAIIHVAALRDPSSVYIKACRNVESGHEAAKELKKEGIEFEVEVLQLDVTTGEYTIAAVSFVEEKYRMLDTTLAILWVPTGADELAVLLSGLRQTYNTMLNTNLTSVAVVSTAFLPFLHKSPNPKVIDITSGIGSITSTLTKMMASFPPYGASKMGMNGLTAHMQVEENDRITAEEAEGKAGKDGRIRFCTVAPEVLKTAFANYVAFGKNAKEGAEVVMRLMVDGEWDV
ncbi:MAG: hypothetical protein M1827_000743 [Pycnora praestabilis]|nr:MAG: hypothetical protein M1827_000743 [Pycnora praestabilis]